MMNKTMKDVLLLGVLMVIFVILELFSPPAPKKYFGDKTIGPEEAAGKVLSTLNTYFVPTKDAILSGKATDENGLYKVNVSLKNNTQRFYLTKDGALLIFPNGAINIAETAEIAKKNQQAKNTEIPKSDKPVIELFVMSLCPYGIKAEQQIYPIVTSFGDKVDFQLKFITSVKGDNINEIASLHGIDEVREDARQAAIMKYYPDKFSAYIDKINENSCVISCRAVKLEDFWKETAGKLQMDVNKIEAFAYGKDGVGLLRQNEVDAKEHNADASPTLVINGVKSNAIYQDKEALKQAICSAFTEPGELCMSSSESGS